ncbi:hypothetical protein TRIUR3_10912 [Triticum urartu]|uniref:Uncharacterized protein n=1 Tax=Triticum urartu TaxID=4572 RepID=M7ZQB3_TRIUA|nr:hypothetical protein TRIUR3_10912 [Triticum urartu]
MGRRAALLPAPCHGAPEAIAVQHLVDLLCSRALPPGAPSSLLRRALSYCTSPWATYTTLGTPAQRHGRPLRDLGMNRAPSSPRSPAPVKFCTRDYISGDYRDRVSRLLPLRFVKATKFDYTARLETPRPPQV